MKILKWILSLIFLSVFSFSVFSIYKILHEEKVEEQNKNELIEAVEIPDIPSEEPEFTVDFDYLKSINSNVVGWIVIEDTQVNYPIVQGNNNSYYLNHSYDKKWSSFGSIFMDYSSSSDFSDKNTFIYGHHTRNGSMFGELGKFMKKDFLLEHPSFYLYTPSGNYRADIFSVYTADALSDSYDQSFSSLEEFNSYINIVTGKSKYHLDVDIDTNSDKIITLYSCSREYGYSKYDRYFIHAVLRSV